MLLILAQAVSGFGTAAYRPRVEAYMRNAMCPAVVVGGC